MKINPNYLFLDTETYSTVPISRGLYQYRTGVELMLLSYGTDPNKKSKVWDVTQTPIPQDLLDYINNPETIFIAFKVNFDRPILMQHLNIHIPIQRWRCAMLRGLSLSFPGGLAQQGEALGMKPEDVKLKSGKNLIQLFCKPTRTEGRNTPDTHPQEWEEFKEYARVDCDAMIKQWYRMPNWGYPGNNSELELFYIDSKMNEHGVHVDLALAQAVYDYSQKEKKRLNAAVEDITSGTLKSMNGPKAAIAYLESLGVSLPNLQKGTVAEALTYEDLPSDARHLLEIRQNTSQTSVAKFKKILDIHYEGRLYDTIQMCGAARTGRFAGRGVQLHNVARTSLSIDEMETAIDAFKLGIPELLYKEPMKVAKQIIRPVFTAPPGKKLVYADYSNIEGRGTAWLAREEWKLQMYRDYDAGNGVDVYIANYASAYGIPTEDVTPEQRQIGKVIELLCGYQGGPDAFDTMAQSYGIPPIPYKTRLKIVKGWRKAHPNTVALWYKLDEVIKNAIKNPGIDYNLDRLQIMVKGEYLLIRLPSHRVLSYFRPQLHPGRGKRTVLKKERFRDVSGNMETREIKVIEWFDTIDITYMGLNSYTRKWERLKSYGGKFMENIIQALARDILAAAMIEINTIKSLTMVLTIHDEIMCEADIDDANALRDLRVAMGRAPWWVTDDMPLATTGVESLIYSK